MDDYEACGECGFDHSYEPEESVKAHNRSKLVQGLIPAKTECPFKNECLLVKTCSHSGAEHPCTFSCASARAHDMFHVRKLKLI